MYGKNKRLTVYDGDFVGGVDIQRTSIQGERNWVVFHRRVGGRVVLDEGVVVV